MYQIITELENFGQIPIISIAISTDHPELVAISEQSLSTKAWELAHAELFITNPGILVHRLRVQKLGCNEKIR
jgi:hypothetical protein